MPGEGLAAFVTAWQAWLLVPFAAALWSRLVSVEAVFEPLRGRLGRGGRFAAWLLSGFRCAACSTIQAGLVLTFWSAVPGWFGQIGRVLTVAMSVALVGVVARNMYDAAINLAQYRATVAKQAVDLGGEGPRYRIIQTRATADGTEVAIAPMTTADELMSPRRITSVSVVPINTPPLDGWEPYWPVFDDPGFEV